MTFDAYWVKLCAKQPELLKVERKMTITCGALRKALQRAFDKGEEFGDPFAGLLKGVKSK